MATNGSATQAVQVANAAAAAAQAVNADAAAQAAKAAANAAAAAAKAAEAAKATEVPASPVVPKQNGSPALRNGLTLLGTMLADSGAGFGVGTFLAKGNMTGISLLVFVASLLFAFEMVIRYTGSPNPLTWGFAGTLVLTGAALIPYLSMAKGSKDRSKVVAAAGPTMVVAWTGAALLFTYLVAGADARAGAIQGAIISIMYLSVSAVGGYNVAVKSRGMALFAAFVWSLLALFDVSGLLRAV
jgi:hypothetical protein